MSRVGSRKSKAENDIADMEIEEIEGIIETKEKEMRDINKEKNKIQRSKGMNQGAKDTKMKPLNEALEELKQQMVLCYQIKEAKIPSYEKLPKDHMYYKHYMQKLEYMKMKNEASSKAADNRYMFEQAAFKLKAEADDAREGSPVWTNKKRAPFRESKRILQQMQEV